MTEDLDWRALRRMADLHAVYRMFDAQGRLLYIGMTKDIGKRLGDHTARRWFPLVANITLQWCPTKAAARVAEVRAIRNERPRYNVADRFGRMPEDAPAAIRAAPRPTEIVAAIPDVISAERLPERVTLAEAVRLHVVRPNLTALRRASQRTPFPQRLGMRGIAAEYDPAALAEWDMGRR